LDRHYQEILVSFYRRRKIGKYYLQLTLQHPNHLYRLLRFGAGFLAAKARSFLSGRGGLLIQQNEVNLDSTVRQQ
ncbi:MAG TPA: hypothetical protein VES91_05195, partial [Burkholderiaceae bacterium]|nr:hypothetical protein [Burkholderiaceae bacterium]